MSAFKDPFSPENDARPGLRVGPVRRPRPAREPDSKSDKTYTCAGHCFPGRFGISVTGAPVNRPTRREY